MSNTPQPHHIHFVIDNTTGEVSMFATKFLPVTNTKGARLKWWVTNSMLEKIGEAPAMQWSYKYDSQRDELQYRLGSGFTVLRQHEALKAIESAYTAEFLKKFKVNQKVRDITTGCVCTIDKITAESGLILVHSAENAKRINADGYQCPLSYEAHAKCFEPLK